MDVQLNLNGPLCTISLCKDPPLGLPALKQEVGDVAGVIEKALAKNKKDRQKDILDFAADLWATQFDPTVGTPVRPPGFH